MSALNLRLTLIFVATALIRLAFFYATEFTGDDAFITFRYAENLASGHGFVYNIGERVLGTTTPLFTLILATFGGLGLPIPQLALLVSIIASGLTSVILYRFALSLRFTTLAILPVLGYMLWPRSVPVDSCGMETALFTLLVTAGFYYQHKRRLIYALGAATLAAWTRPEGYLVLLILLAYNLYHHRHQWLTFLSVPAILLVPWNLFAAIYFGSPIPNSALAKMVLFARLESFSYWETFVYLMGWHSPFGWLMLPLAILGGYWLNKKQNFGALEAFWLIGMIAFYTIGRARLFYWYVVPIYPLYLLFISAAFAQLRSVARHTRFEQFLTTRYLAPAMILLLAYGCLKPLDYYQRYQEYQMAIHYQVGLYLNRHVADDETVAAQDIGYMGYYSGKRILDRDGLVSPEVLPYNRRADYLGVIEDFRPEWIVGLRGCPTNLFTSDSLFAADYTHQVTIGSDSTGYDIFRRINPPTSPANDQSSVIEKRQPQ